MQPKLIPPEPTETELHALLGRSHSALAQFLAAHSDLRPEWKYYGKKLGWNLKLFEGKRNLCFLAAHDKYFGIAFILGGKAVEAALASKLSEAVKQQIRESRQYAEGRGVSLTVKTSKDLAPAHLLLEIKRAN